MMYAQSPAQSSGSTISPLSPVFRVRFGNLSPGVKNSATSSSVFWVVHPAGQSHCRQTLRRPQTTSPVSGVHNEHCSLDAGILIPVLRLCIQTRVHLTRMQQTVFSSHLSNDAQLPKNNQTADARLPIAGIVLRNNSCEECCHSTLVATEWDSDTCGRDRTVSLEWTPQPLRER